MPDLGCRSNTRSLNIIQPSSRTLAIYKQTARRTSRMEFLAGGEGRREGKLRAWGFYRSGGSTLSAGCKDQVKVSVMGDMGESQQIKSAGGKRKRVPERRKKENRTGRG